MMSKIILSFLIIIFVLFNMKIVKDREYIPPLEQLLFVNPLVFKIFTNLYSAFYADKLWLMSSQVDEMGSEKRGTEVDTIKLTKGYTAINYLDPNFTQPISYVVSYLIINEKKYELGMDILNKAIEKSPTNTKLLFLKLVYITTYSPEKPDMEEAIRIAQILYEKDVIFMGALKVSDFVAETVEYYTSNEEDKLKNLQRIYQFAKDDEIKADLDEMIKKYNTDKGEDNE